MMEHLIRGGEAGAEERSDSIYNTIVYTKEELLKKFCPLPKSRTIFVTIKSTPKSKPWSMDRARKYLTRYSDRFLLVESPKNGIHFHALVFLKKNRYPPPVKYVHMNIQTVGGEIKQIIPSEPEGPDPEEVKEEIFSKCCSEDLLTQIITQKISNMIRRYWDKLRRKERRLVAKTERQRHLLNILNYLDKNFRENKPEAMFKVHCRYK